MESDNEEIKTDNKKRYVPFDFPKTRGLDVDSRGFFNGDWLSRSFSVSASKKQNQIIVLTKIKAF